MYKITVLHKRQGNPRKSRLVKAVQFAEEKDRGLINARLQFGDKFDYVAERV